MNKSDAKLLMLQNGYKTEQNEKSIQPISLDPKTLKKLKQLRKRFGKSLSDELNAWIESIDLSKRDLQIVKKQDVIIKTKSYSHDKYKFTSFNILTKNKRKLKLMSVYNNVSISSVLRYFINSK